MEYEAVPLRALEMWILIASTLRFGGKIKVKERPIVVGGPAAIAADSLVETLMAGTTMTDAMRPRKPRNRRLPGLFVREFAYLHDTAGCAPGLQVMRNNTAPIGRTANALDMRYLWLASNDEPNRSYEEFDTTRCWADPWASLKHL